MQWPWQRKDEELNAEIQSHLDEATRDRMARGESAEQAAANAQREFGNVGLVKEVTRELWGWSAFERLMQDLRFGLRVLRRNPAFTFVALLTLALGIGANTAIFSVVNGILLKPLPYAHAEQLAILWSEDAKRNLLEVGTSYPNFEDWRSQNQSFADLALCSRGNQVTLLGTNEPERVLSEFVTANLFPLLGVSPVIGRTFTAAEEQQREPVAVLSYALWQRRFGGAPDVIGKTLEINGDMTTSKLGPRSARIVGVMPANFTFPTKETQLWEPASVYWGWESGKTKRFADTWRVVGRLKAGVSARQAQAELNAIGQRLAQAFPSPPEFGGFGVNVVPLLEQVTGRNLSLALWVLLGAVGFVLLIACANVANLLLARGAARERELAVRAALGAGRARLMRQMLTESLLLALGGGALGLLLAMWGAQQLARFAPGDMPRLDEIQPDARVLWFAFGASLLAGVLFGLIPAWKLSRSNPNDALKEGGRGASGGLKLLQTRGLLIVAECALAVVLLTGAGLLIRSFLNLQTVNPGFNPESVLLVRVERPQMLRQRSTEPSAETPRVTDEAWFQTVIERLAALPGTRAVGSIDDFLLRANPDESITVEGSPAQAAEQGTGQIAVAGVTPGFFQTMGVPLLRGRFFTQQETLQPEQFAAHGNDGSVYYPTIINEAFARRYFPIEEALGKRFFLGPPTKPQHYEVIGVVGNMHRQSLEQQPIPEFFVTEISSPQDVVVRVTGNPLNLANAVRQQIRALDANASVFNLTTVEQRMGDLNAPRRFQTHLLTLFALLALMLALIGIYGVLNYSVTERQHEIGIRLALGARGADVLRLVIGQGLQLTLLGIALGFAASLALTRLLSHLLFGVSATDPVTFAIVALLLVGVALLACYLPARKASRVDPLVALKCE